MTWTLSHEVDAFRDAAGGFLAARPDRNTVLLSVTESLASLGADLYGADAPVLGWWRAPGGDVAGALLWTPPHAVNLTAMPPEAADALPELLAGLTPAPVAVRGEERPAESVAAGLARRYGTRAERVVGERLYRLDTLRPPHPAPPGRARPAGTGDRDLLLEWVRQFQIDIGHDPGAANPRTLDSRIAAGRMTLWEADGEPVSMVSHTAPAAGTVRIGPVYTPAALRGRGFAGAATAATARRCLDAGLHEVLLFADRDNPTSTALYERLGFVRVEDCATFAFGGADGD